jgi:hypothetical protein
MAMPGEAVGWWVGVLAKLQIDCKDSANAQLLEASIQLTWPLLHTDYVPLVVAQVGVY